MVENEEHFDENMYAELERDGLVNVLTREESRALFDRQARRRVNMSGEEFLRAWDAGEFDEDPESVMFLAMLIPFAR